jgi:nitroreductase
MEKPATGDHPMHEIIARRWSPRAFDGRPVPAAALRSMFEAARWASSSFNEQPWRFIVARRDEPAEFERALSCLVEFNRTWAARAAALILTSYRTSFTRNGKPNACALHDLGQAAAHLALQATALGLAVHQMAGILPERVRELYAVPAGFQTVTAIALGYAGRPEDLPQDLRSDELEPRSRDPQERFVFGGAWDRPASW